MRKSILAIVLAVTATVAVPLCAAVNVKQLEQQRQIDAGHRSGKLNGVETRHLKTEQRSIARDEARMRARHGGHLTARDKRIIHARQRKAHRDILWAKHNRVRGKDHLPF